MRLQSLIDVLENIAPTSHAEPWDNVGLLVGDPTQNFKRVLLTIDYTDAVAREAAENHCDAVISYHPPIFDGLKHITATGPASLIYHAIRQNIAIYSPHTALDAANGGTNDVLADAIGLTNRQPLRIAETKSTQYKLIVFIPQAQLTKVSDALFAAGAGKIGNYSACSFQSPGTGTFFGESGTNPAIGQSGKLETAAEIRLETVVSIENLQPVLTALRETHPYEEPAFDLNQLAAPPEGIGQGRIGEFPSPVPLSQLIPRLRQELQIQHILLSGHETAQIKKVAICAGAGGTLLDDAISQNADLYLTGELRHHDALKAARAALTVLCTLHTNSERPALKRLKTMIEQQLPGIALQISKADSDPFKII